MARLVSRISVRTVCGDAAVKAFRNLDEPRRLFRLRGLAAGMECGTTVFGDRQSTWTRFVGQFVAYVPADGKAGKGRIVGPAPACFLPKAAQALLEAALRKANAEKRDTPVLVDLIIGVEPAGNNVGYTYTVDTLDDSIQSMLLPDADGEIPGLLAEPEPEPESEPEPEPEPDIKATAKRLAARK